MIPRFSRQFFGAQDRRFGLTQIFILSVIRDDRCKDALHNESEMLADYDFFSSSFEISPCLF